MLPLLEVLLRASPKVVTFHVIDNDPVDEENFLCKIRCELTSGRILQIRLRAVAGRLRYSYQEFADKPLQRWDNAPHFPHLPNFPHHYHGQDGNVGESTLTGEPALDLPNILGVL